MLKKKFFRVLLIKCFLYCVCVCVCVGGGVGGGGGLALLLNHAIKHLKNRKKKMVSKSEIYTSNSSFK